MTKVIKKPHAVADLESAIVRLVLARDFISRSELARELKLVASTAGIYADRLIKRGYLLESKSTTPSAGRPPVLISLNPRGGRFIGVDFDASQILAVAVDFTQRPLVRLRRKIPAGTRPERVLARIEVVVREAIGPCSQDVLGIGVGVPGLVDAERGVAHEYRHLPGWHDVPIRDRLAETFGVPVFVENNARAMALGELWSGHGRGLRNLVCLTVRRGIGSGTIVDGKPLRGALNHAGEVGVWACPEDALAGLDGAPANRLRTVEEVASVPSVLARAGVPGSPGPKISDVLQAADSGARPAFEAVEEAASYHGWILHQLALLFDPERLVVCGPMAESRAYHESVKRAVARLSGPETAGRVFASELGPFSGALGASALAFHLWRPRR